MEIEGIKIKSKHIGLEVIYIPRHAHNESGTDWLLCEHGIITSFNDRFVFVNYGAGTSNATPPELLIW